MSGGSKSRDNLSTISCEELEEKYFELYSLKKKTIIFVELIYTQYFIILNPNFVCAYKSTKSKW